MEKRLYKSNNNRMIAGICGGIAEYLNCDPTIIRIAAVIAALMNGLGIIAYIIMCFIVPTADSGDFSNSSSGNSHFNGSHYSDTDKTRDDSEFDSYFKN